MIPRDQAEAFWGVTRDCLIQFHGIAPDDAANGVASLRERLARTGVPMAEEMIYHDEPFNVACDIAGKQLDDPDPEMVEEYHRMLDRPFPVLDGMDAMAVHEPPTRYGAVT